MSRNPVDYLHGTLETLILKTLASGPKHGYGIAPEELERLRSALRGRDRRVGLTS